MAQRITSQYKPRVRSILAKRDGWRCHYCGEALMNESEIKLAQKIADTKANILDIEAVTTKRYPTVDHVIEFAKGGSNRISNLVLACYSCNNSRSRDERDNTKKYSECELDIINDGDLLKLIDLNSGGMICAGTRWCVYSMKYEIELYSGG